jgi:hypothetical protein
MLARQQRHAQHQLHTAHAGQMEVSSSNGIVMPRWRRQHANALNAHEQDETRRSDTAGSVTEYSLARRQAEPGAIAHNAVAHAGIQATNAIDAGVQHQTAGTADVKQFQDARIRRENSDGERDALDHVRRVNGARHDDHAARMTHYTFVVHIFTASWRSPHGHLGAAYGLVLGAVTTALLLLVLAFLRKKTRGKAL